MIYQETLFNLMACMQEMGKLRRDQIIKFFASELPPMQVKHLLDQMTINHKLVYDEAEDTYRFPGAPRFIPGWDKKMIHAFWVLVQAGSQNVMEIMRARYPSQLAFISPDNHIFDITIISNEQDAKLAQKIRNDHVAKNEVDITTHIGIVYRDTDIKLLESYGFDLCAKINPNTHEVTYVKFEN